MRLSAFNVICVATLASAFALSTSAFGAEEHFPSRQITLIVGFAPGGVADGVARLVGQKMNERFGQPVVVENRAGAGGNRAARAVATSAADGYSVLVTTTAIAINETLYRNKGYRTEELTPVAIVASTPEVIAVSPQNAARSMKELLAAGRDKGIMFGTAGVGSGSHIAAEYLFKRLAHVDATHVPFQGGAPAVNAALGGHVEVLAISMPSVLGQIQSNTLRGLGIASRKRLPSLPDVPTYEEEGFKDFYPSSWVGFFVPAETPAATLAALNDAIEDAIKDPASTRLLDSMGFEPILNSPSEAVALMRDETQRWGAMVREIGQFID